jgi:hypothetical protein
MVWVLKPTWIDIETDAEMYFSFPLWVAVISQSPELRKSTFDV